LICLDRNAVAAETAAPDEAREVTHMARRIAALILLQPELDKNYEAVKAAAVPLLAGGEAGGSGSGE
jgi:hypothetical protein